MKTLEPLASAGFGNGPEAVAFIVDILKSSADYALIGSDGDGQIRLWNEGARRIYGYTPEEVLDKIGWPIFHSPPMMQFDWLNRLLGMARHDGQGYTTLTQVRKNGTWFTAHLGVIPCPAGGFLFILQDLTEQSRPPGAPAQASQLAAILDSSDDAIMSETLEGVITGWNPAAERLYGYTAGEAIGRSIALIVPPERAGEAQALLEKVKCGERIDHLETIRRGKDGRLVNVVITLSPIKDGLDQITGAAKIVRRLTPPSQAEAALRQSEERRAYQAYLLENVDACIVATDAQSCVTAWNRAAETLYGWTAAEVVGRDLYAIIRSTYSHAQRAASARTLAETGRLHVQSVHHRKDGTPIQVEGTIITLPDSLGQVTGYLYMYRDITERKRAEAEQQQLHEQVRVSRETLQALSRRLLKIQEAERRRLVLELHDEIGQVLTALRLLLEIGPRVSMSTARTRLAKAQQLVGELMEQVHTLSLDLRPTVLDDLGLLPALMAHFKRYTAVTDVQVNFAHDGLGQRFGSDIETATYRIVQEALTNVARYAKVARVWVRVWADQVRLNVQIEDRGVGFNSDAPVVARASHGLAGMRERAILLRGRLTVESLPGVGTQVIAWLPLDHPAQHQPPTR